MNRTFIRFGTAVLGTLAAASAAVSGQIESVQVRQDGADTVVEISGKGLGNFFREDKTTPPQLVLSFDGSTLGKAVPKKIDQSADPGQVLQVSSFTSGSNRSKVVIDFKRSSDYEVNETENGIQVKMTSAMNDREEAVVQYSRSVAERQFTGSPITIQLKDADVTDVLRLIGEASGFNVIIHPQVNGKISLSMVHVPWDQALDVVLQTLSLGAERNESVLRILPSAVLIQEKQAILQAKALAESAAPKVTRIFPISYADPADLVNTLKTFATTDSTTGQVGTEKAAISIDKSTNSIVVRDTLPNIDKIKKLVEILDVQIPQVLIEAKVVEATEGFGRTLNGAIGTGQGNGFFAAFNGNNPVDALVGTPGNFANGAAVGTASLGGATLGWSPNLGFANGFKLTAFLNLSENENRLKVVSSPRTVVISGKPASIRQSIMTFNQVVTQGVGGQTITWSPVPADLKLDVTPRVTNEGSVLMKLNLKRDTIATAPEGGGSAPAPREMNSEVLVDSGSTLVIGGVMSEEENITETGIPLLRKIPLIGWFFGRERKTKDKTELMFFITPKVLNLKRSGIGGNS